MTTGPVGLSLVAPRGRDAMLLDLVAGGIGELGHPDAPGSPRRRLGPTG
jgi:hypothetical protein